MILRAHAHSASQVHTLARAQVDKNKSGDMDREEFSEAMRIWKCDLNQASDIGGWVTY